MGGADRIYQAVSPDTLVQRELDGLSVMYHRPSGRSHILTSPLPELLHMLDLGPATKAELGERLLSCFALAEAGDAFSASLTARLDELVSMGLVTYASSEPA